MEAGIIVIKTAIDNKNLNKQLKELKSKLSAVNAIIKSANEGKIQLSDEKMEKYVEKAKELKGKIKEIRKALSENREVLDDVGNSLEKGVKKIAKWGLALFGIRSAYSYIRSSISKIAEGNEEVANKVQAISNTLYTALAPVMIQIVNLVYRLMQYVQYIVREWTGYDIFSGAKDNLKSASKSAKDLKKSLAGFDTATVFGGDGGVGDTTGGGASMEALAPGKEPKWLEKLVENKDLVLDMLKGILGLFLLIKGVKIADDIFNIVGSIGKLWAILKPILIAIGNFLGANAVAIGGIVLIIAGLSIAIQGLISYLNDPSFSNFGTIIIGIGFALAGLALILGSVPIAIAAIIAVIVGIVVKFWDDIKAFIDDKIIGGIDNIINWLREHNLGFIAELVEGFKQGIKEIVNLFDYLFTGVKQIFNGIMKIFKCDFKSGFVDIFKGIANICIGVLNTLITGLNSVISPIRALIVTVGNVMGKGWTMDNIKIPTIPKLAVGGVVNMPGKGIMYGGANIAERGAEGVIPLTNDQSLEMIADAIARKMSIIIDLTNKIDGRVLSRSLEQVRAKNNFARNGV